MPQKLHIDGVSLSQDETAFLQTVARQMSIVADLSRADILMYGLKSPEEFLVMAHAQPHSLAHVYNHNRAGRTIDTSHRPEILRTLTADKHEKQQRDIITEGAPVVRETLPIHYPPIIKGIPQNGTKRRVIAALVIVTNLIEHERQKFRSKVYNKRALPKVQAMLLRGQVFGAENISPFGEQDGILYTDSKGIIRYASGIGANLYRRIGYIDTLEGRPLRQLETGDEELRKKVLAENCCLEWEAEEGDRHWARKGIPVLDYPTNAWERFGYTLSDGPVKNDGVLIIIRDDTELRRQDEAIRVKNAMIQEVHHRVKNNLQTIAGLLRMKSRRVQSEEAKQVLDEALNRVLSVAVIHEYLSANSSNIINIKDVSNRIIVQFQQGIIGPDQHIELKLTGDTLFLPARQATATSLIINELLQNAIEHGFETKKEGTVLLDLADKGDEVIIKVADSGQGVPEGFQMEQSNSLGLTIVKTLVESDLKGQMQLGKGINNGDGLTVEIVFPKTTFKGEEGWNEHVSL